LQYSPKSPKKRGVKNRDVFHEAWSAMQEVEEDKGGSFEKGSAG